MKENEMLELVNKNEEHIKDLVEHLSLQIDKYNAAHKLPEPSVGVTEDCENVRDNFLEFCNHSKEFVDALVEIRKNTLQVISSFPNMEGWLGPQEEDDWETFMSDVSGKPRRNE